MLRALLVALAGAAGALSRYGIGVAVGVRAFPWATLTINVAGSFFLGVVLAGPGVNNWSTTTTVAASVGFLGAFTTFSTFAYEGTALIRDGRAGTAAVYVASSMVLGLLAAAAGYVAGRSL